MMDNLVMAVGYALDTFYFLMGTVLVMWMAAGFAMLESGLVRGKNTVEMTFHLRLCCCLKQCQSRRKERGL
jgi:ammonia channel protein AmtB